MDLPILKYVDVIIGFALVMILASTVVLTFTQLGSTLARSRGKYLSWALRELFTAAISTPANACSISATASGVARTAIIRPRPRTFS